MAHGTGQQYDVAISAADSDASYTEIGDIKDVSFSDVNSTVSARDNDSGIYDELLYTMKGVTVSVTCNHDQSDTGQLAAQAMQEGQLFRYIRVRPYANTNERQRIFRALCTTYEESSGGTDGIREVTITFVSTGTITYSNQ